MATYATFQVLIDEIQAQKGYTLKYIYDALGIAERTFYRKKSELSPGDEIKITPEMIQDLARLLGTTCQDVATRLGYGFLYGRAVGERKVDPYPLATLQRTQPNVSHAIELAVDGRNSAGHGDSLYGRKRRFQLALEYLDDGIEPLLALYIRLLLADTLRMMGNVREADKSLSAVRDGSQEYAERIASQKQPNLHKLHVARLLTGRADAYRLILNWSTGHLGRVITEAPTILASLEDRGDYAFVPYVYYGLGRSYNDLEQPTQALVYAKRGLIAAYQLEGSYFSKHALFLDHPPDYGYHWRVDHLLQLMTDTQIALGDVWGAEETYRSMHLPKSPATSWSLQNWFALIWQEHMIPRRHLWVGGRQRDDNIIATFDTWREKVKEGGNPHIQAVIHYQYARTMIAHHQLDIALVRLKQAIELADTAGADYVAIMSSIELSKVYSERRNKGDRELALTTLDMIKGKLEKLNIPFLWEQYHHTHEVAVSVGKR